MNGGRFSDGLHTDYAAMPDNIHPSCRACQFFDILLIFRKAASGLLRGATRTPTWLNSAWIPFRPPLCTA